MNKNVLFTILIFFFCLRPGSAQSGLLGEYFTGANFEQFVVSRTDQAIDFNWDDHVPPAPGVGTPLYSIRWTGRLRPPETGSYYFSAMVDDGIRVWVGDKLVIDAWGLHDSEDFSGTADLTGGQYYNLKVEYYNGMVEGEIHLNWELPGEAPVFKGLLGHNDKKIEPKYFFQPVAVKEARPEKPLARPARAKRKPVVPAPKPALADTIEKFTPKNILFEQSKSVMLPGSFAEMDLLADMLLRYPTLKVMIEGHTDNLGDPAKNQKLSEERARTVAVYLIRKGVSPERISTAGFGGSRPLTQDNTPEGHAKNRRVVFLIR